MEMGAATGEAEMMPYIDSLRFFPGYQENSRRRAIREKFRGVIDAMDATLYPSLWQS
jgi:hypothetical protein